MYTVAYFLFVIRVLTLSLPDYNQAEVIEAFSSSSRYLDDLLNIDNPDFEPKVNKKVIIL